MSSLTLELLQELKAECDIDDIGVAPLSPVPVDPGTLERLAAGMPSGLRYVWRRLAERLDPTRLLPGARFVVVGACSYATALPGWSGMTDDRAFVSRFAWCRDYHDTIGRRFQKLASLIAQRVGCRTKWYVDTGPILEKAYAAAAGLGFVGKHTLLINRRYGSYVFLGVVLVDTDATAAIRPSTPYASRGGCGSCMECVEACPVRAIRGDYTLDHGRCLAYLNVSHPNALPWDFGGLLRGNLYGCDICQEVCPHNHRAMVPDRPEFRPMPGAYRPELDRLLALSPRMYQEIFGETPVRRRPFPLFIQTVRLLWETRRRA